MKIVGEVFRGVRGVLSRFAPAPKIGDLQGLKTFWTHHAARIAGEMTIKYSQKRLGRGHFGMCKDDNYARALVDCQITLHAAVLTDAATLTAQLLNLKTIPPKLKTMMQEIHKAYINTAPEESKPQNPTPLTDTDFTIGGDIKTLSDKTGALLFKQIPLTEDLLPGNKQIFQGQIRATYISTTQHLKTQTQTTTQTLKTLLN